MRVFPGLARTMGSVLGLILLLPAGPAMSQIKDSGSCFPVSYIKV